MLLFVFFFFPACDILLILWMKSEMYFAYWDLLMKNVQVQVCANYSLCLL